MSGRCAVSGGCSTSIRCRGRKERRKRSFARFRLRLCRAVTAGFESFAEEPAAPRRVV